MENINYTKVLSLITVANIPEQWACIKTGKPVLITSYVDEFGRHTNCEFELNGKRYSTYVRLMD
jgi:hypothetical protein